jgi:hypothetical protein
MAIFLSYAFVQILDDIKYTTKELKFTVLEDQVMLIYKNTLQQKC